jgi:hypothetical protein
LFSGSDPLENRAEEEVKVVNQPKTVASLCRNGEHHLFYIL